MFTDWHLNTISCQQIPVIPFELRSELLSSDWNNFPPELLLVQNALRFWKIKIDIFNLQFCAKQGLLNVFSCKTSNIFSRWLAAALCRLWILLRCAEKKAFYVFEIFDKCIMRSFTICFWIAI